MCIFSYVHMFMGYMFICSHVYMLIGVTVNLYMLLFVSVLICVCTYVYLLIYVYVTKWAVGRAYVRMCVNRSVYVCIYLFTCSYVYMLMCLSSYS